MHKSTEENTRARGREEYDHRKRQVNRKYGQRLVERGPTSTDTEDTSPQEDRNAANRKVFCCHDGKTKHRIPTTPTPTVDQPLQATTSTKPSATTIATKTQNSFCTTANGRTTSGPPSPHLASSLDVVPLSRDSRPEIPCKTSEEYPRASSAATRSVGETTRSPTERKSDQNVF